MTSRSGSLRVTFILPALTEATSPFWRPIKYSLFPPLGLAALAGHLRPDDEARIVDEHVDRRAADDAPDLAVIQVYITNARRAYAIADEYRARGRSSRWAGCTSPRCPTRRRRTPTQSSSGRGTRHSRGSWPTSARAVPRACIGRRAIGRSIRCRPSDAI